MRPVLGNLVGVLVVICIGCARAVPACSGAPPGPGDGSWPPGCRDGEVGVTCNAICDKPGFTSVNVPVAKCTASGWQYASDSPTACAKVCDGAPPILANGVWGTVEDSHCENTIGFGSTCVGTCNANYVGSPTVQCMNGWATPVGACAPPGGCAGPPPAVANAAWLADCRDVASGTECNAVCSTAPRVFAAVDGSGNPATITATCTSGVWVVTTAAPTNALCIPTCGAPPVVAGVSWGAPGACTNVALPQGKCEGSCSDAGAIGSPVVTCTRGAWGPVTGACAPAGGCPGEPPAVTNTVPPTCTNRVNGATCTYSCKPNTASITYGPSDPAGVVSTCTDGTWTTPTATCTQVCKNVPAPVPSVKWGNAGNHNCAGSIPFKGVCSGTCSSGNGSPTVTCLGNTWSAVTGGCAPAGGCPTNPTNIANAVPPSCVGTPDEGTCKFYCKTLSTGPLTYGYLNGVTPTTPAIVASGVLPLANAFQCAGCCHRPWQTVALGTTTTVKTLP